MVQKFSRIALTTVRATSRLSRCSVGLALVEILLGIDADFIAVAELDIGALNSTLPSLPTSRTCTWTINLRAGAAARDRVGDRGAGEQVDDAAVERGVRFGGIGHHRVAGARDQFARTASAR